MNNTFVVGMGEALWDMLPEGKKIGGAPANFAYHHYKLKKGNYIQATAMLQKHILMLTGKQIRLYS